MTRKSAKPLRQKQTDALARRENNLKDYNSGNVGSLVVPEGIDKSEFLKAKIANAEAEIAILKKAIGKNV